MLPLPIAGSGRYEINLPIKLKRIFLNPCLGEVGDWGEVEDFKEFKEIKGKGKLSFWQFGYLAISKKTAW